MALLVAGLLALAACGDDSGSGGSAQNDPPATATSEEAQPETTTTEKAPAPPDGTEIELGDSEFGSMLFDSKRQAIYIFENDPKGKTVCYDDCAEAWPPVFTDGEPRAGKGVKQSLLGTVKRRDGKRQVTYAGKPLYFYVNEEPGQVLCHNVHLNGGLWWVVGPDGKRRPA
jgi:predicted lipoprotein with Yx(FWY)xxD motif